MTHLPLKLCHSAWRNCREKSLIFVHIMVKTFPASICRVSATWLGTPILIAHSYYMILWLYTKIGVLLHFYSVFRIIHEKVRVSELQYSIFLRSYLKIRERKKLERKKVRAQPLCHLNNPPTNPFDLLDISMLLYHKETGRLDGESKLV